MKLDESKKVDPLPLMISAICVIWISLIVIPFFVHPLIAYTHPSLMFPVLCLGIFVLIPFMFLGQPIKGAILGIGLIISAIFVSLTGILFTYHAELRQVVIFTIPILFSLAVYYLRKYSTEWNSKFTATPIIRDL